MPKRPLTDHIDTLRVFAGNEQLAEILNQYDTLSKQLKDWSDSADLAAKRKPAWSTLQTLLKYSKTLPESEDLNKQANAVRNERRLLDETDPIPAIHKDAVKALRAAVKKAHDKFKAVYDQEMAALTENDNWKNIRSDQQQDILDSEGIAEIPSLSIGDDSSLLRTLEEIPLTNWKTKIDALPQQFRNAALQAARLLEPQIQYVGLSSGTLKSPEDVMDWVEETREDLMERIKNGPIIIS